MGTWNSRNINNESIDKDKDKLTLKEYYKLLMMQIDCFNKINR